MEHVILMLALMAGGLVGGLGGLRLRHWWERGRRPPRRRIADLRDGEFARVIGVVTAGDLVTAPITGRKGVCIDAGVSRQVWRSVESGRFLVAELVARRLRGAPFVIRDDSGEAVVDPRGASVRLAIDYRSELIAKTAAGLADPEFVPAPILALGRLLQLEEAVLIIGTRVAVDAMARLAPADAPLLYRASADARIHLTGAPDREAVVSNLTADLDAS